MACPELEDLVSGRAGDHAAHCEQCRALLEAWNDVDATLGAAFTGICAPPSVAAGVRRRAASEARMRRPSILPEVLDLIGWAAVLALVAVLAPRFVPAIQAAIASFS
jgi:hypothetical protein